MTIPSKYDAQKVEDKWYAYWMKNNYFHSEVDDREPYTIVIPPPNVTGVLHMGHMLNNTIQDVLIRRARLLGKNACWVPGTDHASIATEAKVVAKLKEQGINKNDLTRDEFLKHAFDWKDQYGGIILEQLKKLGASCDWERTAFTMDPEMSESVIKVFVDLYNKGLIYRGYRMVNWDPEAKTTLSDEEVIHEERQGNLYYLKYKILSPNSSKEILSPTLSEGKGVSKSDNSPPSEGLGEEFLVIATTRPETIFGDTAICINPNDERFTHLKGKKAIVPLCGRIIPIIEDEYVDVEFGTGCLKVTPAHDENDKNLGDKHNLEVIDIFNDDASLNSFGLHYQGKDRFVVRKEITQELTEKGFLIKTEVHTNKVGTSERTKAVIEPRLSDQWFLKMEDLVKPAIGAVLSENPEINLFPKKFENTYKHWLENIRDWNISRQLWWGQQIPAFYYGDGKEDFVVAECREDAFELAKKKLSVISSEAEKSLKIEDLKQDEDALDTWFSSWLWPISVFDGIRNPDNKEINYYYPTNDLVTGPDILFFWVARMIFAGYEYRDEKPFQNVYLTGLVRDKQRRKMSKSLGNSPDALKLIDDYGADGVRVGLLLSSAAGNDLMFDEDLCQQGKGFANKIWNAFRLIKGWEIDVTLLQPETAIIGLEWYEAKFQKAFAEIEDHFSKYRLSDALMTIYKLIMDDFSSWLLEIVKPAYQQPIDKATFDAIIKILENNLKVLHPFMPFLTEEIWQFIAERTPDEALIIAEYPEIKPFDNIKNYDLQFDNNEILKRKSHRNHFTLIHSFLLKERKTYFTNYELAHKYIVENTEENIYKKIISRIRKLNELFINYGILKKVKIKSGINIYTLNNINNEKIIADFDFATSVISGIRTIRKDKNIPFRDEVALFVINNGKKSTDFNAVIQKLTNVSEIKSISEKVEGASFRVKSNEYFVPISEENIDVEAEIEKLSAELKRAESFLVGIQKKLSNERFVANAPEQVIIIERKKEEDTLAKIQTIISSLNSLK